MKKSLVIIGLIYLGLLVSLQAETKRYDVKSGKVVYKIGGGGKVAGMFSTSTSGEERLVFKEWGNIELRERKETQSGMQNVKTHTINKLEDGISYHVDFDSKSIYKRTDSMMASGEDMHAKSKEMIQSMGGKKIGSGKVLGYSCEIWEVMGSKIWVYKGVPLKVVSSMMGVTITEEAVSAKFNSSLSKSEFALPNFPIQTQQDMMEEQMMQSDRQPKQKVIKESVKEETQTQISPCTKKWKRYFDCMDKGDKDLQGYQNAIGCDKLKPNPVECPPQNVTMEGVKDDFKDMPSMDEMGDKVNKFMEGLGGLFSK